jgi:bacterioferritin-associated ferredoxin
LNREVFFGVRYPISNPLDRVGFEFIRMYVCLCKIATDKDVSAAISEGARTVEEVGEACGAGTGCGACRPMIHEMLEASGLRCAIESGSCSDCPASRIPVALPVGSNGDSREAA